MGGRGPPPELVSQPLAVLGAALASQPSLSAESMVARCLTLEAPLTLRVLFSLQLSLADGSSPTVWMPSAIRCVRAAAVCRVSPAREFELLPLWFFVVELVAHEAPPRVLTTATNYPPTTHYLLRTTYYLLPTNYLLATTYYYLLLRRGSSSTRRQRRRCSPSPRCVVSS